MNSGFPSRNYENRSLRGKGLGGRIGFALGCWTTCEREGRPEVSKVKSSYEISRKEFTSLQNITGPSWRLIACGLPRAQDLVSHRNSVKVNRGYVYQSNDGSADGS